MSKGLNAKRGTVSTGKDENLSAFGKRQNVKAFRAGQDAFCRKLLEGGVLLLLSLAGRFVSLLSLPALAQGNRQFGITQC